MVPVCKRLTAWPQTQRCAPISGPGLTARDVGSAQVASMQWPPVWRGVEWCARALSQSARESRKETTMSKRPNHPLYHSALSFKWLVGLILIVGALYAYFINHASLLDAAMLFGIGVILA